MNEEKVLKFGLILTVLGLVACLIMVIVGICQNPPPPCSCPTETVIIPVTTMVGKVPVVQMLPVTRKVHGPNCEARRKLEIEEP